VIARKSVRSSPLPQVQNFQPHPARTPPQPCFIILVIPAPNAAKESATPRHAKNGVIARKSVRSSPLPPVQNFQPHPARTPPQPCFIILVIPTPNAAEESATPRHAKSGIVSSPCKHDRAAVGVMAFFAHRSAPASI